ncbi:MAG: DAK2 domain-containing protein, partial [Bellilinea sp.]
TMFEGGLSSIQEQTKARVGDKTLMDALIPSVAALRSSAEKGNDILSMLDAAANAAQQGAEATKNFPARFGRAKYQGDRTLGKPDPGSISMALVFKGFINGLKD